MVVQYFDLPITRLKLEKNRESMFSQGRWNLYSLCYFTLKFQRMSNTSLKNYKIATEQNIARKKLLKRLLFVYWNFCLLKLRIWTRFLLNCTKRVIHLWLSLVYKIVKKLNATLPLSTTITFWSEYSASFKHSVRSLLASIFSLKYDLFRFFSKPLTMRLAYLSNSCSLS